MSFNKLLRGAAFVSLLLYAITTQAQAPPTLEKPLEILNQYNGRFPLEKAYLHTDRKHYAPGESVWFKAYLAAGFYHEPSPMSKNLYLSLHRSDGSVVDQQLIRIDGGVGHGVIDLPDFLQPGSYVLRAYTNWMKNFDEAYFFEKELKIMGEAVPDIQAKAEQSIDLQFFPESGSLIDQVETRVAFKAINEQGKAVKISGIVYDNENQEVMRFETEHEGMGYMTFTPQKGKNYRVFAEGQMYMLPRVQSQGFSLKANNLRKEMLELKISANEATRGKSKMGLLIHSRGAVGYTSDVDVSENVTYKNIPKSALAAGINHIMLFDEKGQAVLERLVFIDQQLHQVELRTDSTHYEEREKVTASIKVTDRAGNPVSGYFSMAVLDLDQTIDQEPGATIVTNLLLNSDLKGHIANPGYYFDPNNSDAKRHLDLVMMTHGWSRFEWEPLSYKAQSFAQFPVEQGLKVTGRLSRENSTKPAEDGAVTLINQDASIPWFKQATVDERGDFVFVDPMIYDHEDLIFQGVNKRDKPTVDLMVYAKLRPPFFNKFHISMEAPLTDSVVLNQFNEKKEYRDLIDQAYDLDTSATLLGTVVVEADREKLLAEERSRRNLYGPGDDTYWIGHEDAEIAGNAMELLRSRYRGVFVNGFGQSASVSVSGSYRNLMIGDNPPSSLILLNNMAMDNASLMTLPANTIERIEIYRPPRTLPFGPRGANGVIAIYTKQGVDYRTAVPADGVETIKLENSYRQPRAFYEPKYDVKKPEHIKPDSRMLISWQPMIYVDETGMAKVEFWNTDLAKEVLLDLQGLTVTGTPLATTIRYQQVKPSN